MKEANDKLVREEIEKLEQLPGLVLDKAAAWNKLQLRMETPAPPIALWRKYSWLAAAILLLCISIGTWMIATTKQQENNTFLATQKPVRTTLPAVAMIVAKNIHPKPIIKPTNLPRKQIAIMPVIAKDILPIHVNPIPSIQEELHPIAKQTQTIAAAHQPKVVHINEIFEAPEPIMAQKQERLFDLLTPNNIKTSVAVNHEDNIHFPKRFKNNLEN